MSVYSVCVCGLSLLIYWSVNLIILKWGLTNKFWKMLPNQFCGVSLLLFKEKGVTAEIF